MVMAEDATDTAPDYYTWTSAGTEFNCRDWCRRHAAKPSPCERHCTPTGVGCFNKSARWRYYCAHPYGLEL